MGNFLTRIANTATLAGRSDGFTGMDPEGYAIIRGDNPTEYQRTGRSARLLGFERHPVVQACARLIADIAGHAPIEGYEEDDDGNVTVLPKYPAAVLLAKPRVAMTGIRLRSLTVLHYVLYGNAFWFLERANPKDPRSPIQSIRILQPEFIQYVYLDPDTLEVMWYRWRDRVGRSHLSTAYDVVHFKDLTANDPIFGYPRMAAALIAISADDEAGQYVRQIVTNHGSPGVIVKVPAETGEDQMRKAKRAFTERWTKRGGRGGVAFLRNIEEVIQVGFNLEHLEFPDMRAINRQDICTAAGVDPNMIGANAAKQRSGSAGMRGEQYKEARFRLIQQTVKPIMLNIEGELDDWFAPEFGPAKLRFSASALANLTENEADTSTRMIAETAARIRTREEARRELNLDDEPDPQDVILGNTTADDHTVGDDVIRATAATTLKTNPPAPPALGPGGVPPKPKPQGDEPPPERSSRFRARAQRLALGTAERGALWAAFDTRATAQEGPYQSAAALRFHTERAGVAESFRAPHGGKETPHGPHVTEAALNQTLVKYGVGGAYRLAWQEGFRSLYQGTFAAGMAHVVQAAGAELQPSRAPLPVRFDLHNPRLQAVISERAKALADFVSTTTADQISQLVSDGLANGLSTEQIADQIDAVVFGDQAAARAALIARTESIGALNEAEYVTATETGLFSQKEWLTQGDDRVRDSHAEYEDAGPVAMEYEYAPGLVHPGDQGAEIEEVANCRCSLLYYTGDEEAPA